MKLPSWNELGKLFNGMDITLNINRSKNNKFYLQLMQYYNMHMKISKFEE
jgi:hypothetical protein